MVAISSTRLVQGLRPVIYGDGSQTRDFVYVGDVAAATRAALLGSIGGPLNVGTGRETSVREVVAGSDPCVRERRSTPDFQPAKAGRGGPRLHRPGRAERSLGWKAANFSPRGSRPDPPALRHPARTDICLAGVRPAT